MADKFFFDTNILLYAHDRSAGAKHERARQLLERLWTSGEGVLSTQVLQELCINLRRKIARPLPVEEIRQIVQDYLSWEIVVNTRPRHCTRWKSKFATKYPFGMLLSCTLRKAWVLPSSIRRTCRRARNTVRFKL